MNNYNQAYGQQNMNMNMNMHHPTLSNQTFIQNNNNNHLNGFNLNQMQYYSSSPNIHKNQNNNYDAFVPPSPQSMAEQTKFRDWRSKRQLIDDEKRNKAEEMKVMDDAEKKEAERKRVEWLKSTSNGNNALKRLSAKRRTKSTGSILKRQNDFMNQPLKVGYMQKEGKIRKSWKRRWFVLQLDGKIKYYKDQNSKKEIATIDCNGATRIVKQSWGSDKQWGLKLFTPDRNWKFMCISIGEQNSWHQAFQNIINVKK